ncbi:MAG: lipopolysaccharide assembly protein LapA domain-containing protein [Gammaproteobacteria bacterium]|nr:lipopolysaccharide assembly protein LapA domain-containing protein [Gammaproteobacteria bacterium]
MKWFWLIMGIVLFLLGIGFALLNPEGIDLNLFVFQFKTTLALALLGFFVVGGLMGLMVGYVRGRWKSRKTIKPLASNGRL